MKEKADINHNSINTVLKEHQILLLKWSISKIDK